MVPITGSEGDSIEGLEAQRRIEWNHFCRGWISKMPTKEMMKHYPSTSPITTFTGIGCSKRIIVLMIDIHVDEWYHRCNMITDGGKIKENGKMISLEKNNY